MTIILIHNSLILKNLLYTSLLRPHLRVNSFNILPLRQRTLVTSKTPLSIFVNSFIGGAATGLDHIEDSAFIRGEAGDFAGDFSAESSALAESL